MKRIITLFVMILIFACFARINALILDNEISLIKDILNRSDLCLEDLNFLKDWSPHTRYKIPLVVNSINNPLDLSEFAADLKKMILQKEMNTIIIELSNEVFFSENKKKYFSEYDSKYGLKFENFYFSQVVSNSDIFDYIELVYDSSYLYHVLAFEELDAEDKKKLTYLSYSIWQPRTEKDRYLDFLESKDIPDYSHLALEDYEQIINRIDWFNFIKSVIVFNKGVETLRNNVGRHDFSNTKPIIKNTKWGNFCIGSIYDDTYLEDFSFILEPAGNDRYEFDLNTDFDNPFYLVLDLQGNDVWENRSIGGLANVLGGIGWLIHYEGDDVFKGGDHSFASFFGFQFFHNKAGNNFYQAGNYSLSAATFGFSLMFNNEGNNIYYSHSNGQGFGGTMGLGILADFSGHDLYYTGGEYFHDPLRPNDFRTLSQGFGFGIRPDWGGGIGVLFDGGGNDSYQGGVYAQGAAYWYALGILIDLGGNDFFNAVQYAQGSGIHLAGGLLYNKAGNDKYFSRYGPGQGAGHDYAVGIFIDGSGDDFYSIDGGNGLGLTNSVGIFIDREGNDRYERSSTNNYGSANLARQSGGIGIFMDLDGDDVYPDSLFSNNSFWTQGFYGFGIDTLFTSQTEEQDLLERITLDVSFIDTLTVVEEIFSIAAEWAVGDNRTKVEKARERLFSLEEETAEYIYSHQLNTRSGLVYRALEDFTEKSDIMKEVLIDALSSADSLVVKNSISLAAPYKDERLIEKLIYFNDHKTYIPTVLSALGFIDRPSSYDILNQYTDSHSEYYRVITARSLKALDTEMSRKILKKMKNDSSFLVKSLIRSYFSD